MSREEQPRRSGLTQDEQDTANALQALLNAYDAATPETQARMRAAASGKGPDYTPTPEEMAAGYAVEAVHEAQPRQSRAEAGRDVRRLEEVSRLPQFSGVRGLLGMLARRGAQILGRGQK